MSLATVQLEADLRRLGKNTALLKRKWSRMSASPFAFLRGASALWCELLEREPKLLEGLPGAGVLVGDLHLENVGTFRTAWGVSLHVNDFDESFEGPWAFDVARLLTSTLLARPELGIGGLAAVALTEEVLDGYDAGLAGASARLPTTLSLVVDRANKKPEEKFLLKRLERPGRLVRDEKNPSAPVTVLAQVKRAVQQWAEATHQKHPVSVVDVTRRVAGTGSLGVQRFVALVKVGAEERLLELKEVRGSTAVEVPPDAVSLVHAWMQCLPRPPAELAACVLGAVPVIVRPLFAADEKLSVEEFDREALPQTMRAIGVLAGEVHRRGARSSAKWTRAHRRQVRAAASRLAGLHEEAFQEFCQAVYEAQ